MTVKPEFPRGRNVDDFRKFTERLKKLYRIYSVSSANLLFENTYVIPDKILLKKIIKVNKDNLTVELKKYFYLYPEKKALIFYRVTASFEANIYYNS